MEGRGACSADYCSTVDTSRPFRSVKEAVAIFGHRFRTGEITVPPSTPVEVKPPRGRATDRRMVTSRPLSDKAMGREEERGGKDEEVEKGLDDVVTKLGAELEETKKELRMLKERESEMEIALATLNAELHRSMSRLAKVEAVEAEAKAAAVSMRSSSTLVMTDCEIREARKDPNSITSREQKYYPTLAEILSITDDPKTKKKKKKKKQGCSAESGIKEKPVIPSVGDMLSWRRKNKKKEEEEEGIHV